ncbi:hypothetical protein ACIP02_22650 [Pseudomonas sp. NPDC089408]|uniref:hypothetical protein n=1 Tax=Pseudomonas sp. NPDC089408 TaxID=3364465 RepID=UPI0037F4DFA0
MEQDTHAPIQPDHNMRGWRIHVIFDAAKINTAREQLIVSKPPILHETIHYERLRGATSELVTCELATPFVQYLQDRVRVCSRIMSYANFIWSAPVFGGKPRASLDRVIAFTRNEPQFLYQEFPLDGFVGHCAGPGAALTLKVGKDSTFYIQATGSERPDVELADIFRQRFNALPDEQRIIQPYKVAAAAQSNWLLSQLRLYLRKHPTSGAHVLYIVNGNSSTGSFPTQDSTPWDQLAVYMPHAEMPDPIYYNDFTDLALLLLPPSYVLCDKIDVIENYVHKMSYRFLRANAQQAQPLASLSFHADPLVAAVSAGSTAHKVEVRPQGTATPRWELDGGGHGSLKPNGYVCEYSAPVKPEIRLADNSLTQEPTATRTSFKEPVRIDRVITGFALLPLVSTFVVLNTAPNFFFKTEWVQGRLKLRFCYIDRNTGKEAEAPASMTQWKVLAGDGKVDKTGIFTPGLSSRFTVIQAVMDDPINWYWAYIIVPVPLMTAETFVARWNKR